LLGNKLLEQATRRISKVWGKIDETSLTRKIAQ